METIDLGGHIEEQLQLGEEGKVVGGDVGMWAAADIVLYEPVGVQGPQDAQHVQVRLGVENIVNDTLRREETGSHFNRTRRILHLFMQQAHTDTQTNTKICSINTITLKSKV